VNPRRFLPLHSLTWSNPALYSANGIRNRIGN
jgi:hypothetical protein